MRDPPAPGKSGDPPRPAPRPSFGIFEPCARIIEPVLCEGASYSSRMLWIDIGRRVMHFSTVPLSLVALAGCSPSTGEAIGEAPAEATGTARSALIGGTDSDASQDAVVFLVHKDPTSARVGMCTGTLVAPNLVITARHCVADADESALCAADGSAMSGGAIAANHDPKTLLVYTGKNRPPFKSQKDPAPAGVGAQIVDDGAKNLCNHDLALLVLQAPIADAPIASMRLDGDVKKDETFTAVGWGITSTSTTPPVRQQRAGVKIVAVGPDATRALPVAPNQFEVGESICLGDSGGPAIASSGAILGVVTGGGNGQTSTASDPSAPCVGDAAANLYTRLAPFKDVITKAFGIAGAEPWVEGEPDPRLPKPAPAETGDAPSPSMTSSANEASAPSAGSATSGGCSSSPAAPSSSHLALLFVALGLAVSRIRRAR